MADPTMTEIVRQHLQNLAQQGILARMGVVFGSHASGHPGQESDIDLSTATPDTDGETVGADHEPPGTRK